MKVNSKIVAMTTEGEVFETFFVDSNPVQLLIDLAHDIKADGYFNFVWAEGWVKPQSPDGRERGWVRQWKLLVD